MVRSRRKAGAGRRASRKRKGDERQLDLLDWLDAQPSHAPKRPRLKAVASVVELDEDQLDLVELIAGLDRAA